MRRRLLFMAAGLASALGLANAGSPGADLRPVKEGSCGSFGTSIEFVSTPSQAGQQAKKEQKLVFVLHVSGHFEDPRFT